MDKTYEVVLKTLAEKIEDLKLDVYLKDLRIKELERELGGSKEASDETV